MEARGGIVIASSRHANVFGNHGLAFFLKLLSEDFFQRLEADPHHVEASSDRERILGNLISRDVGQLGNGKRTKLHSIGRWSRLYGIRIIDTGSAGSEKPQMAIHGVLV